MCSKQNRRFKYKHAQYDYRNKCIKQSIYHANVNVSMMEQNVIQINDEITVNVDVSVKNIIYVKKIMFGTLVNVFVKMENI